ncbi:MAG: hypothetical protein ACK40M_00560 [Flavobacteriales bacterium]
MPVRVIILIFILPFSVSAQSQRNGGIESRVHFSKSFGYEYANLLTGALAFVRYKELEIYFGYNTTPQGQFKFDFSNSGSSVVGLDFGGKYHLLSKTSKSHFFGELNTHHHRFVNNRCRYPCGIHSNPIYYSHGVDKKCSTSNIHLAVGTKPSLPNAFHYRSLLVAELVASTPLHSIIPTLR